MASTIQRSLPAISPRLPILSIYLTVATTLTRLTTSDEAGTQTVGLAYLLHAVYV